ncbi:MAG: Holliday junction branch migration protein RuvA [Paludibacteraceae bacterium]|nr:Holliday junction branch migration protein RuvA [Paludibacteraceae bacterium]
MIEYLRGEIAELSPTSVTIESSAGVGYYINISLPTYSYLADKQNVKLYVHEVIREDAYILYGFLNQSEREFFLHLISVSGVGANTARMIMSSLSIPEIQEIILSGNVNSLKAVKGIGQKTAERIIVELKDKIGRVGTSDSSIFIKENPIKSEAVSALVMLGFNQQLSQKTVDKIYKENPNITLEQLVKMALKMI